MLDGLIDKEPAADGRKSGVRVPGVTYSALGVCYRIVLAENRLPLFHTVLAAGRRRLSVAGGVGGVLLVIDAKNDRAAEWYRTCGAIALDDAPHMLVQPLARIRTALLESGKL